MVGPSDHERPRGFHPAADSALFLAVMDRRGNKRPALAPTITVQIRNDVVAVKHRGHGAGQVEGCARARGPERHARRGRQAQRGAQRGLRWRNWG